MPIFYNSDCSTLSVGCYLYNGPGLTNPVSDGYYSDGTNCFSVTGGAGYVFSMDSCTITVYINGDISPISSDYEGTFYGSVYSSTTGFPAGAINVDTNVTVGVYLMDDLGSYNIAYVTLYSGTSCSSFSINTFNPGAYVSVVSFDGDPSPQNYGLQDYETFNFTTGQYFGCI